jgi:hypothetical protein
MRYGRDDLDQIGRLSPLIASEISSLLQLAEEVGREWVDSGWYRGSDALRDARYYVSLVCSRNWGDGARTLVPICDLVQSTNQPSMVTCRMSFSDDFAELIVSREVKRDQELSIFYGFNDIMRWYVDYGIDFFFPINYLKMGFRFQVKRTPASFIKKQLLDQSRLSNIEIELDDERGLLIREESLALQFFRIVSLTVDQMQDFFSGERSSFEKTFGLENEQAAVKQLLAHLRASLVTFERPGDGRYDSIVRLAEKSNEIINKAIDAVLAHEASLAPDK